MQNVPPEQPQSPLQQEERRFAPVQPPNPYQPQSAQAFPAQPPYAQPYPQPAPMPPNTPYYNVPPVPGGPQAYAPPAVIPAPPFQQGAQPPLSPQAQKYLKTIPIFQRVLQRELRLPSPLPYWIEDAHAPQQTAGGAIGDALGAYFGGSHLTHIFTAHFKLPWPGTAELHVRLNRHGHSYYPILLYTATLGRPVPGEAVLDTPKLLSWAKFVGNPTLCQKLNNTSAFLKDINKFARTEESYGSGRRTKIKISRFARLSPQGPGQSQLAIRTLPRKAFTLVGEDYHFDAQQFLTLAAAVEAMIAYP